MLAGHRREIALTVGIGQHRVASDEDAVSCRRAQEYVPDHAAHRVDLHLLVAGQQIDLATREVMG